MVDSAREALVAALERARALHEERRADPELAAALDRLAAWQTLRLRRTFADLDRDPRYAKAVAFFQSDLYGPGDYSDRDADFARIVPVMARVLPEPVLGTVAKAMELSALSNVLDRALLARLPAADRVDVARYCDAYRACANRPERERQIALTVEVGEALDRYVHKPLLRSALAMMRRPASAAGFGALHAFVERGLDAFSGVQGATALLATIAERESTIMEAIFAGDHAPFSDPGAVIPQ